VSGRRWRSGLSFFRPWLAEVVGYDTTESDISHRETPEMSQMVGPKLPDWV